VKINTTETKDQDARTFNTSQEDIKYPRDGASRIPHRDGRDTMLVLRISYAKRAPCDKANPRRVTSGGEVWGRILRKSVTDIAANHYLE
jgi:hypothetical protein